MAIRQQGESLVLATVVHRGSRRGGGVAPGLGEVGGIGSSITGGWVFTAFIPRRLATAPALLKKTAVHTGMRLHQENVLQSFKLPRPALCIGGILQIELLGRVQQQEMDNMYYICVCHVKVVGYPLYPKFDVDVLDNVGSSVLKYFPDAADSTEGAASEDEMRGHSGWHAFAERIRQMRAGGAWNHVLLSALLGNVPAEDVDDDSGDELFE